MASQKSPDTLRRLLVDLCTRSPPPRIILVYSLQQNWKNLPNLLLSLQAETHLSKKFGHIHPLGRNNSDCCARRKFSKNSQNQGRSTDQIPYFFSFLYSVQNGEEEVILETRLSYVDILICVHFSLGRKLSVLRSSTGARSCLLFFSRHFSLRPVVGGNSP